MQFQAPGFCLSQANYCRHLGSDSAHRRFPFFCHSTFQKQGEFLLVIFISLFQVASTLPCAELTLNESLLNEQVQNINYQGQRKKDCRSKWLSKVLRGKRDCFCCKEWDWECRNTTSLAAIGGGCTGEKLGQVSCI